MKEIEKYINTIYKDFDGSEAEIKELKEEMKTHLLETVFELKSEGKSEKEAIQIALERFGDKRQISKGLFELFKAQRIFAKSVFRIAIVFLIFGLISLSWLGISSWNDQKEVDHLINRITLKINDSNSLTKDELHELRQEMKSFFEENKTLRHIALFHDSKGIEDAFPANIENAILAYPENTLIDDNPLSGRQLNDKWFIQWQKNYQSNNFYFIPFGCFVAFAVLIIIWIVINSYNRKFKKAYGGHNID